MAALEQELHERKRAESALQGSQQRLRLALEASRMGTWDYDVSNDLMEWSAEMAAVVGAPLEQHTGSLHDGFAYLHPDERPAVERAIKEAIEHGSGISGRDARRGRVRPRVAGCSPRVGSFAMTRASRYG